MTWLFAALIGWCGTKYPGWWRNPPPPDPEPWWRNIMVGLVGAGGGVLAINLIGAGMPDAGIIGVALASFAGGAVGAEVLGGVLNVAKAR